MSVESIVSVMPQLDGMMTANINAGSATAYAAHPFSGGQQDAGHGS